MSRWLVERSLTLWRQEGKEDQGITFVQVRFCGYCSMYKQWGGYALFGSVTDTSSVVSVPKSNTGIWLPENSLWSPSKHDTLRFGP
ncbi:hypothetical protein GQ457_17G014160 [Hibiscus cannabinus]